MNPIITINEKGNYELTEYDTTYEKQVTLEFLGTADREQLSQEIRQTLKDEYLRQRFESTKK